MNSAVSSQTQSQGPGSSTQNNAISRYTYSFGISLAICSIINALLVVAKEKSRAVQNTMQKATGNHWITHVAVVVILFIALGFLAAPRADRQRAAMPINRLIKIILAGICSAGVIIVAFYFIEG